MLDRMNRTWPENLPHEFDDLAGELRVTGIMTPTPQPSALQRAELRAAVLAHRNERSRSGVGGFRGVVLGVAMVAGSGMVIASAAGGGNAASFVAEVVREISVPVSRPEPREPAGQGPHHEPDAAAQVSTATPAPVASATPPPARGTSVAAATVAAEVRESPDETVPVSSGAVTRPANTDTKPDDTRPSLAASDVAETPVPTKPAAAATTGTTSSGNVPAASLTAVAEPTRTSTPEPTKTPGNVAPAANAWPTMPPATATPSPTPTPKRTDATTNDVEPLTQDQSKSNVVSAESANAR